MKINYLFKIIISETLDKEGSQIKNLNKLLQRPSWKVISYYFSSQFEALMRTFKSIYTWLQEIPNNYTLFNIVWFLFEKIIIITNGDTFCTRYDSSIHNNVHLKCGHESNPSLSRQRNWELRREEFQEAEKLLGSVGRLMVQSNEEEWEGYCITFLPNIFTINYANDRVIQLQIKRERVFIVCT